MHNKLHKKPFKDLLKQWVSCGQQKKLIYMTITMKTFFKIFNMLD